MLLDVRVTWLIVAVFFQASAGSRPSYETLHSITKVKNIREISVESLNLEPLCDEVLYLPFFPLLLLEIMLIRMNGQFVSLALFITVLSYQNLNLVVANYEYCYLLMVCKNFLHCQGLRMTEKN